MIARTIWKLRSALFGAVAAALVLTTTTALAGSGVGGVFNLGQVNTVDAQSTLTGNPAGNPLFKLVGSGTAATIRAEAGSGIAVNGISVSGTGQFGQSTSGYGLFGTHTGATGVTSGVWGQTSSTDPSSAGVTGRNFGGGPGLSAIVTSNSVAPLKVNSSAKVTNLNADLLDGINSTRFWRLGGNSGTTPGADFLGTTDNQALELKVNGSRAFRIEPTADTPNLIGGSAANFVAPGVGGATIGGGGVAGAPNAVTGGIGTVGGGWNNSAGGSATVAGGQGNAANGNYSAVGGGFGSTASGISSAVAGGHTNASNGDYSTVAGGHGNTANSNYSAVAGGESNTVSGVHSVVGGGLNNSASGGGLGASGVVAGEDNAASGDHAFIGAGLGNTASGSYSAVAGGESNIVTGNYSAVAGGAGNTVSGGVSLVAGGYHNSADGLMSFAAGTQAKAFWNGSFVWGDRTFTDLTSPAPNTFTVRASGGIWLGTTSSPSITAGHFIDTSTGGYLSSAGAWTDASDRALKHDFRPLDRNGVLEKVARMPITSWSYKAERPSVRHIGPMAQDFYAAFGLGLDDKHISTIDEGGVALAAIQGLYRQNLALQRQNTALSARLARLEHLIKARSVAENGER